MPAIETAAGALFAASIAAVVSAAVIGGLIASGWAHRVLDRPNARSMHAVPTPRIGGLGVLAGLTIAIAATSGALPAAIWVALATIATVSALDDLRALPASIRLTLHGVAAAWVTGSTLGDAGALAFAVTALAIAWSVNLYNFMDGSDALAGTMGVLGFGACGAAAAAAGDPTLALACAAVAGACVGFLVFNMPPARTFMGDAGSTSLGLLAGAIGALGVARGLWTPWLPAAVFLPFAFDATATLLDRVRRGCRVWEAHREHAYQRLNLAGLGHRRTAIAYALMMGASGAGALLGQALGQEAMAFIALFALHAVLWGAVRAGWRPGVHPRPADPG
jgi:UDP-N-acetylmuramyl pentapeptide phosphotransferase/UDP-N-acetylglucosamine-1-phosphate transferase